MHRAVVVDWRQSAFAMGFGCGILEGGTAFPRGGGIRVVADPRRWEVGAGGFEPPYAGLSARSSQSSRERETRSSADPIHRARFAAP